MLLFCVQVRGETKIKVDFTNMHTSETFSVRKTIGTLSAMMKKKRTKAWLKVTHLKWSVGPSFVLAILLIVSPQSAHAMWRGYDGVVNDKYEELYMRAGETKSLTYTFTNTGTETWYRGSSAGNVNLYFVGTRPSELQDATWLDYETVGRIHDDDVRPGESTTVTFNIHAPHIGSFTEVFRLASDDVAWMRSAETKVVIHVSSNGVVYEPTSESTELAEAPQPEPNTTTDGTYSGLLLLKSTTELELAGDSTAIVTYGFKNTGSALWDTRSLRLSTVQSAMVDTSDSWVHHDTWESSNVAIKEHSDTKPGEIGFLTFTLKAPPKRGSYTVRFALFANDKQVDGAYIDIPITVTSDGYYELDTPVESSPSSQPSTTPIVSSLGNIPNAPDFIDHEPIIRVGLFRTIDDQMKVKGYTGPYRVYQGDKTICSFQKNQEVTIKFDRDHMVYKVSGPGCTSQSSEPYQVRRTTGEWDPLEMSDYHRPVSWYPGADDNKFRGILELRYAEDDPDHDVWTVNELPMELYLRGIAETSDSSPLEYQKALLIAARTYGHYHWTRGTKHKTRGFQIDGKYDQVYRGYGAEERSPKIVRAVMETRGQIVTYQGKLAITPYFSRSDGRTRDWGEVWYGGSNYPWLKSVPVPHDVGRTLWGHGVGMSATGALDMAKDGDGYMKILKHFYTGIEIMKVF